MTGAIPPCRFCGTPLHHDLVDLGLQPFSNAYLRAEDLDKPEPLHPLRARVCTGCWLVQADVVAPPEVLFDDYAYFSSYSASWVDHARRFAEMARDRFKLGPDSHVVEVASNDGYLLQHFVRMGIPCRGIEPAANVAAVAEAAGVPSDVFFLGRETGAAFAKRRGLADLVVGNNVLAHVPDPGGFVAGLAALLKPKGVVSVEFPHLLRLLREVQFDTIYHEHFSYLSLGVVERMFASAGLQVFDVTELPTHGGSLRVMASPTTRPAEPGLLAVRAAEREAGLDTLDAYTGFAAEVEKVRQGLLDFLATAKQQGKRVAAYGAAAKGNTLLNHAGVNATAIPYVADLNIHKQGRWLPMSRIPIVAPEKIIEDRPDYVLILPWNIKNEIAQSMVAIRDWGGRFVTAVPRIEVF